MHETPFEISGLDNTVIIHVPAKLIIRPSKNYTLDVAGGTKKRAVQARTSVQLVESLHILCFDAHNLQPGAISYDPAIMSMIRTYSNVLAQAILVFTLRNNAGPAQDSPAQHDLPGRNIVLLGEANDQVIL